MRITAFLLLFSVIQVMGESSYSQNTRLSLNLKDVSIENVLDEIENQSEFFFLFNQKLVNVDRKVDINAKNKQIKDILADLFTGEDVNCLVMDRQILLSPKYITETVNVTRDRQPQEIVVTGKVTDEDGNSLPGVNIVVKGTMTGTITDVDGNYSIQADDPDATLVFSFIGMLTREIKVGDQTEINITMAQDIIGLKEIIAIGYGTVRKSDLTGSISTISSKDFERVPATNILQAMQGRATGINITTSSGMPGAGNSVLIRGVQSIYGTNSPIFVVDGIISTNINNINHNDIESISILKDASATAIYGARAANGVILITTKRGQGTGEPRITFDSYVGMQTQSNLKLDLLNAKEWLGIYTEAHENAGIAPQWTQQDLQNYEGVDSDWMDAITQTGVIQKYDLGIAGSSEKSNYYISTSYLNHKGMVLESGYSKYTLRFNSDHKIKDWIKFGNSLNLYASETDGLGPTETQSGGHYKLAAIKVPLTRIYEEDGGWGIIDNTNLEHMHRNPVWVAKETISNNKNKGVQGNLYINLTLLEGLEFTTRGNFEYSQNYYTDFAPAINSLWGWEGDTKNLVEKRNTQTLHWTTDFLLNYHKTFGADHRVKAIAGYSIEENTYEYLSARRNDTPNNSIQFLNAGDPSTQLNENGFSDWAFASLFGRLNYTYKNKYLLTATIRRDGTSRLAEEKRYGIFPSVSIAWRITEENFMSDISFIDDLKIRASLGSVGNVLSIGPYGTIAALNQMNYVFNESSFQGYTLASAVNSNLVWENTQKKNIGLDAVLFNNQVYSNIDFFIEDTYDLLFRQPIPYSTGLSGSPFINAGQVRNTGVEVLLGYRKRINNDWSFDVNVNATHVKNEAIDLEGRDLRTSGIVEGFPVKSFFGYQSNGIIYTQSDLENNPHLSGKDVGDIWIKDIDGYDAENKLTGQPDNAINSADRSLIGKKYPDLVYGAMGTVSYKNLSFQIQLQGVQGIDKNILGSYNDIFHYWTGWAMNHEASVLDRFHPTKNPDGKWPIVSIADTGHNRDFSSFWLKDASFLRVKNVNLNYNFSNNICEKLKMEGLAVYISIQNLYTFTKFPGTEVDTNTDPYTGVPQAVTWTCGVKATF